MRDNDLEKKAFTTRSVRLGSQRSQQREHNEAIYPTSSFVFESAAAAAGTFRGEEDGNVYSRFTNPNVQWFERRLASLEQGAFAVGTASGMGAITLLSLALLKQGDEVILGKNLFGSTLSLFKKGFSHFGITALPFDFSNTDQLSSVITSNTRMVLVETPSNPLGDIVDIAAVAAICREHKVLLAVDNCFCTPALMRPLTLGADIVIHSATKYLDGQGRCIGGAVVLNDADLHESITTMQRSAGITMSPFNAWVFNHGLETLALRMQQHCTNAQRVAEWLDQHQSVTRVYYPGLESHPGHAIAREQQSGYGGVLSFEVDGGEAGAWRVIDATQWLSITANLGDAKTTITHPASTTHGRLSEDERAAMGISNGLIRISVGLEDADDIIGDLQTGLSVLGSSR